MVDASPESTKGALAIAKLLRLDPTGKAIDELKDQLAANKIEIDASKEEIRRLRDHKTVPERRGRTARRRNKQGRRGAKNDVDHWLDRLDRDVAYEIKKEGYQPSELIEEMIRRVWGLESEHLADEINRRYGKGTTSGSSIRRRGKAMVVKNSEGEKVKLLGAFCSKRYAEWERYRRGEAPGDRLADGSTKLDISEPSDDAGQESQAITRLRPSEVGGGATAAANREADGGRDGDDRQRNLMDDTLMTATVQEAAELEIVAGNLVKHEGGTGLLHLRPPQTEPEHQEDLQTRAADEFLRTRGIDPHAAPWRPVR